MVACRAAREGNEMVAESTPPAAERGSELLLERIATGRAARAAISRSAHAAWTAPADRPDPIRLLQAADAGRVAELVPLRYARMAASPFAFLRGAAAVMAHDLSTTPATG